MIVSETIHSLCEEAQMLTLKMHETFDPLPLGTSCWPQLTEWRSETLVWWGLCLTTTSTTSCRNIGRSPSHGGYMQRVAQWSQRNSDLFDCRKAPVRNLIGRGCIALMLCDWYLISCFQTVQTKEHCLRTDLIIRPHWRLLSVVLQVCPGESEDSNLLPCYRRLDVWSHSLGDVHTWPGALAGP